MSLAQPLSPSEWIRSELLNFPPYVVPDSRGMVKLDAMENPFSLPLEIKKELEEVLGHAAIHRYPSATAPELKALLRTTQGIPANAELMLGNGSDELIQILAQALAKPEAVLLSVEPSFVMYRHLAQTCGMQYVGVSLQEDFSLDEAAILAEIKTHQPAVVFLSYPNNPTGNAFDRAVIEKIIDAAPGLVVIDEAYAPFSEHSFLKEVLHYSNVLVMRTLSKLGLAGLRLGFLVGHPQWIAALEPLRLPYNINVLSQLAAVHVLRHEAVLKEQAEAICHERHKMMLALEGISGVTPYASQANFILFHVEQAEAVYRGLKEEGVLIKCLHGSHPLLKGCLRVSMGTSHENAVFLNALKKVL